MKKSKILAAVASALLTASTVPMLVYAESDGTAPAAGAGDASSTAASADPTTTTGAADTTEPSTDPSTEPSAEPSTEPSTEPQPVVYKVTFLGFEGEEIAVMNVEEGASIDYSLVDTSVLHKHLSVDTEREFYQWDIQPETATADITIHALSQTAVISHTGEPKTTVYNRKSGSVDISGLNVFITLTTQTPEKDADGNYIVTESTVEITSSCTASPATLDEAFKNSDTAAITVLPIGDTKPILKYTIKYERGIGDVDGNGLVDGVDASAILVYNANATDESAEKIPAAEMPYWDVNNDGLVDGADASLVLKYQAELSDNPDTTWAMILS